MSYVNVTYRIRQFLLLHLAADVGADLVDTRIYALLMPQNVVFPAVVISHLGSDEVDNLNQRGKMYRSMMQIDVYAKEYSVSNQIGHGINKTMKRLANASYGAAPQELIKVYHDSRQEILEEAGESKEFRVMQRFAVWHYET